MTGETADGPLVSIEQVHAAARVVGGVALRTPLIPCGSRRDLLLKAESLQPVGAFKIRGAYNAVAALAPEARARGVITYSSGNHAQGVARAAALLHVPAVVVMPATAPALKRVRVEADRAEVVSVGPSSEERRRVAEEIAAERGLSIIPPYDDDRIIAGQGTAGLEVAEDVPDLAAVLVPVGGGGLASGVAVAVRALRPRARVIGVEPELAADARDSLAAGRIIAWSAEDVSRTVADGARAQSLGRRTFAHLRALLDGIVTVSEAEIIAAVRLGAEEARLVIEPTGALALAAALFHPEEAGIAGLAGTTVAVISGGNVDPERYREYLASPLPRRT